MASAGVPWKIQKKKKQRVRAKFSKESLRASFDIRAFADEAGINFLSAIY